ncbi:MULTISPECIES: ATP-dependent 6-phosphofructokinase [unclassified Aeromicrobium]|uniref:ATP-dependent 6-phosphofructokinase n=1 Tax=unclassified Aeromicrobium TaxID=2633570 RepID=UPI0006FFE4DF|nr:MULTISPECIES: ATP-dependent 6-phosphofructokinase [unclassified Aeromicrobium]KQO36559.1 diphosphate--fructose-6-phosphate 1-phosphotransferase [Aeromicrobium sp. Leaf245]KQP78231.1 diphosphate--fructose-6-phosphate 1-phosphotransferase [Aeromicrobium sp. Leaf289]KQP83941.1 diphosphate--fructose-6-phosphate 1-phosphotransferase [Aeromicrobium sp. Leaf291]
MVTLAELQVRTLGPTTVPSPLAQYVGGRATNEYYVGEDDRILFDDTISLIQQRGLPLEELPSFETGGPRDKLFFDPATVRVGIVTCGGLCPGLNDVIRALVMELHEHYGVNDVIGFRNGYAGLVPENLLEPVQLTPGFVANIHERGGTVLGSSRGAQDVKTVVDTLQLRDIDILFVIGGDGSMRGAHRIAEEALARGAQIAVVGVPKTIDNDIPHIGQSFGFQTAYSRAAQSIKAAKIEAEASLNGVGLVKVMGRHAGFIACYSALAGHDADFVLIPEVPFELEGENGLLEHVRRKVQAQGHAVLVVAEGAGQEHLPSHDETDASGNARLADIGRLLRERITDDFSSRGAEVLFRYFDPGYFIRSVPAEPADSVYCSRLAQTAVHAAMAGRTDMVVGRRRHRFVHVPIPYVTHRPHHVSPDGDLWLSVLESTAQPFDMR